MLAKKTFSLLLLWLGFTLFLPFLAFAEPVPFGDKMVATMNGFKKMSDGTYKAEFTIENTGEHDQYLSTVGLQSSGLCDLSLLDLVANKRYFPLKSPEGCVGSREYENTLHAGKSIRLWLRFPKLPPEVKTITLDLKVLTFDDLSTE